MQQVQRGSVIPRGNIRNDQVRANIHTTLPHAGNENQGKHHRHRLGVGEADDPQTEDKEGNDQDILMPVAVGERPGDNLCQQGAQEEEGQDAPHRCQ